MGTKEMLNIYANERQPVHVRTFYGALAVVVSSWMIFFGHKQKRFSHNFLVPELVIWLLLRIFGNQNQITAKQKVCKIVEGRNVYADWWFRFVEDLHNLMNFGKMQKSPEIFKIVWCSLTLIVQSIWRVFLRRLINSATSLFVVDVGGVSSNFDDVIASGTRHP